VRPSTSYAIRLRNETVELARLSAFVSEFCEREQLPPDFDMVLNLVAEEAFMNVVLHGFEQPCGSDLSFTFTRDEQAVTLIVEDAAKAFNPLEAPEFDPATPIEQRRAGGLGIHLLRNLMNELQYERLEGQNRLTMRKLIPSA
jgi:anti-sigma regulatory factor (Ser/Thr protein kinase)